MAVGQSVSAFRRPCAGHPRLALLDESSTRTAGTSLAMTVARREDSMERIPQPIMDKRGEPHMKRFEEQRWLLDNIVRANGIDWDQPRSLYISRPCGLEGNADIHG